MQVRQKMKTGVLFFSAIKGTILEMMIAFSFENI